MTEIPDAIDGHQTLKNILLKATYTTPNGNKLPFIEAWKAGAIPETKLISAITHAIDALSDPADPQVSTHHNIPNSSPFIKTS